MLDMNIMCMLVFFTFILERKSASPHAEWNYSLQQAFHSINAFIARPLSR